jgi:hypothetical protein
VESGKLADLAEMLNPLVIDGGYRIKITPPRMRRE